jgi:hypothetical protein
MATKFLNIKDRGLLLREVADFPVGVVNDGIIGFVDAEGKKFVRNKRGSRFTTSELGIKGGDYVDVTQKLVDAFNHPSVKTVVFDVEGGGDITIDGVVNCFNKTLVIKPGTRIVGTGTITGGKIDARLTDNIFGPDITANFSNTSSGEISPMWFGALANDVSDDSGAFNKMFLYFNNTNPVLKVIIPSGKYYVANPIDLPLQLLGGNYHLHIEGKGSQIRTDQNISILRRLPSDALRNGLLSDYICSISGILFLGNLTTNTANTLQKGIEIAATYSWRIFDCAFTRLYDGIVSYFSLHGHFYNLRFTQCLNVGIIGRHGYWTGATTVNSAFNANTISNCRFVNHTDSRCSIQLLAADQTLVKSVVSEGNNPLYNFEFDYVGSTGVLINTFEDIWLESTGGATNPQNINFKLSFGGVMVLKNIQRIYPNQLFDISSGNGSRTLIVDGLPYVTNRPTTGMKFLNAGSVLSGSRVVITNIGANQGDLFKDANEWEGGFIPQNMEVEYTLGANAGKVEYTQGIKTIEAAGVLNFKSRYQLNANIRYMNFYGALNFPEDNLYNIGGNLTTNLRPARVSANRFLADVNSVYGFAFGDNTANPVEYITRPESGVMRLNATGGIDLPIGTTAQRPTGVKRRLRYNSDLSCIEWFNGVSWISFVSRNSIYSISDFNIVPGADRNAAITAALAIADLKTLVFDLPGGGDITVSGTLTIPAGKVLKFENGTKLIGTYTLSGGIIDANPSQYIFGGTPTVSGIEGTMDGKFYSSWMGIVADGTTDDYQRINKCLTITNIKHVIFNKPGVHYSGSSIVFPSGKSIEIGRGVIFNLAANRQFEFRGDVSVDENQYWLDPSIPFVMVYPNSIPHVNVKWFGAVGDGVTNDSLAFWKAADAAWNKVAGSLNHSVELYIPPGKYRAQDVYIKSNVRGGGETTSIQAVSDGSTVFTMGQADSQYPNVAWDFKYIKNLCFVGGNVSNGVKIDNAGIAPGNQYAGRWVFENVAFKDCVKAISKTAGNLGNRYTSCSFQGGEFHYHAVQNVTPVMHTGNDYFNHCHFSGASKAVIYIDQDQNGGGHHFNDCIIEGNPGFAIYIKAYGNALFPFVFENTYLEANGTSNSVVVDGITYTQNFVYYFGQVKHAFMRHTAMFKRKLVNSVIIWEGSNEYIYGNGAIEKDETSVEISNKALGFQLANNNVFHNDAPFVDPDDSANAIWRGAIPSGVSAKVSKVLFSCGPNPELTVWNSFAAAGCTIVDDPAIFSKAIEIPTGTGTANIANGVIITEGKYYLKTALLKRVSGTGEAKIQWVNQASSVLSTTSSEWQYFFHVHRASASGGGYMQIHKSADTVWRIGALLYVEFNSYQEAYEFVARNTFPTTEKVSSLAVGVIGGQKIVGGSLSSEDLELESTSSSTKGSVKVASGSILKLPNQALRGTTEDGSVQYDGTKIGIGIGNIFKKILTVDDLSAFPSSSGSSSGVSYGTTRTISGDSNYTVNDEMMLVDTTAGNIIITVDPLFAGKEVWIKKVSEDANSFSVLYPSGTIDNGASLTMSGPGEWLVAKSAGSSLQTFKF